MKQCSYCGESNLEGVLYCEECGSPLTDDDIFKGNSSSTQKLSDSLQPIEDRPTWGHAQFKSSTVLYIQIKQTGDKLEIPPQIEVVFGRSDKRTNTYPDVDLTPFGGIDSGVSRQHAAIRRGTDSVVVMDLDSVNGTFLNGQRVFPNQPRILRDGDELRFGKLVTHVYFK